MPKRGEDDHDIQARRRPGEQSLDDLGAALETWPERVRDLPLSEARQRALIERLAKLTLVHEVQALA